VIDFGSWNLVFLFGALAALPALLIFRVLVGALSRWWQRSYAAALLRANLAACRVHTHGGPSLLPRRSAGRRVPSAPGRTDHRWTGTRP